MKVLNPSIPSICDLTDGQAVFSPSLQIWGSKFGDPQWFFYTVSVSHTPESIGNSINWDSFTNVTIEKHKTVYGNIPISHLVVEDLKVGAGIYAYYPNIFKGSKKNKLDPKTVKSRVAEVRSFIGLITEMSVVDYGLEINVLSDITFDMLKRYIPQYTGRSSHLKRGLQLIANPIVQSNMKFPPLWGSVDLDSKNLHWRDLSERKGIPILTDTQFLWLLDYAKGKVCEFKTLMGLDIKDQNLKDFGDPETLEYLSEAKKAADYYYQAKEVRQDRPFWERSFGFMSGELTSWLDDAHNSAMLIVLLLTGMRETEIQLLEKGCYEERYGYNFLNSKVIKNKDQDAPSVEGWLAIDLVMDAYEVLCKLQDYLGCDYLIASIKKGENTRLPYRLSVLNKKFNRWLKKIDRKDLFTYKFSVHQCRETLVYQLAKHEVGLPFISMQLKHFNRRFTNMPNEVSAGYGEYRRVLLNGIQQHQSQAREDVLIELYGEDAKFAGGGAEGHKQRVDAFFTGLGIFGEERKLYIRKMARQGVRLMPTSIGTCTHNFIATTQDHPPCMGDYSCDPDCDNHLISESCGNSLRERKRYVQEIIKKECDKGKIEIWKDLVKSFDNHLNKLGNI